MASLLASLVGCTVLLILTSDHIYCKTINSFAGPYIAFGHNFVTCPSANAYADLHWRLTHFNPYKPRELQRLSGNATFTRDIKDGYLTRVDMSVWANNQWKENAFIFNYPNQGCSALRDQLPNLYRLLATRHNDSRRMTMDKKKPCLLPRGFVLLDNDPVDWSFPNVPVIPYGKYKFRITARYPTDPPSRLPSFCIWIDCEVVPKPF